VWVLFGIEEYRIPPLAFGALQDLQENIGSLQGMSTNPTKDQMNVVVDIVHMAVKRNYPDIDINELRDMIDLGNFQAVLEAVLNTSGFKKVESGEA